MFTSASPVSLLGFSQDPSTKSSGSGGLVKQTGESQKTYINFQQSKKIFSKIGPNKGSVHVDTSLLRGREGVPQLLSSNTSQCYYLTQEIAVTNDVSSRYNF